VNFIASRQECKGCAKSKRSDWKILRQLHSHALVRFCKQVLFEIERIQSDSTKSFHQRYLGIYEAMRRRDKEIAHTFNELRRSTALTQLAGMKSRGLITEDEFAEFSEETKSIVALLLRD
jgi:hypothetical protein